MAFSHFTISSRLIEFKQSWFLAKLCIPHIFLSIFKCNIFLFTPSYPLYIFELQVVSMPQPLPTACQAYTTSLMLEASFLLVNWSSPLTVVYCARLLGYLIIHAPTVSGHMDVTNEINSCNKDEEKLHMLAQICTDHSAHLSVAACLFRIYISYTQSWIVRQNKVAPPFLLVMFLDYHSMTCSVDVIAGRTSQGLYGCKR